MQEMEEKCTEETTERELLLEKRLQMEIAQGEESVRRVQKHEQQLQQAYDEILNSPCWKMTWPLRRIGAQLAKLRHKDIKKQEEKPLPAIIDMPLTAAPQDGISVQRYLKSYWRDLSAIPSELAEEGKRINVVVESLRLCDILGGVEVSLLLATAWANQQGAPLRIITRENNANPLAYDMVMSKNGMKKAEKVSFFAGYGKEQQKDKPRRLTVGKEDVFLATDLWSAMAVKETTMQKKFYYILHMGDDIFKEQNERAAFCRYSMQTEKVRFIVHGVQLWKNISARYPWMLENSVCLKQPVIGKNLGAPAVPEKGKYRLLLHVRRDVSADVFHYGLMILDTAISTGALDTQKWEIYLMGKKIPKVCFCDGTAPVFVDDLNCVEYNELTKTIDLLMPLYGYKKPSAAMDVFVKKGVAVVTDGDLCTASKTEYPNFFSSSRSTENFLGHLQEGIRYVENGKGKKKTTDPDAWETNLQDVLTTMEDWQ